MRSEVIGCLSVAGLAVSAHAAVSWTTSFRFLVNGPAGGSYNNTLIDAGGVGPLVRIAGTYSVTVQVGIFNLTDQGAGQSNQGLFNWTGRVSASGLGVGETLGVTNTTSRIAPFNVGPSTTFGGAVVNSGTGLDGNSTTPGSFIQASRDVSGGASTVWAVGAPQPTGPAPGALGADGFISVFRYRINILLTDSSDILTTIAGSAGPILGWAPINVIPPDEILDQPGTVAFLGLTRSATDGGPIASYAPASFTMPRIPAPSSIVLLAAGALIVSPRRRI